MSLSLPNGDASLDIDGILQDIVNNWNALLAALKAQGIDPSFLQNATVTIHASASNVPAATFLNAETALNNWKNSAAVKATTIDAKTTFLVRA